jgi:hypothetical protein
MIALGFAIETYPIPALMLFWYWLINLTGEEKALPEM